MRALAGSAKPVVQPVLLSIIMVRQTVLSAGKTLAPRRSSPTPRQSLIALRSGSGEVELIFSGRLLDADVSSDFGKAAEQFVVIELPAVSKRSTVVILGDGRNNGRAPGAHALEEIHRRARRVIWITPEPRWG